MFFDVKLFCLLLICNVIIMVVDGRHTTRPKPNTNKPVPATRPGYYRCPSGKRASPCNGRVECDGPGDNAEDEGKYCLDARCRGATVPGCTDPIKGFSLCDGGGEGVCDPLQGRLGFQANPYANLLVCGKNWTEGNTVFVSRALGLRCIASGDFGKPSTFSNAFFFSLNCTGTEEDIHGCSSFTAPQNCEGVYANVVCKIP